MAHLETRDGVLVVVTASGPRPVLRGWESWSGWYWFAVEKVQVQDSLLSNGQECPGDTIWYGLVQGFEEELGDFSEGELRSLGPSRVWEIPPKNLPWSGRRKVSA